MLQVEQGDKGGQRAVADRSQGQAHAARRNPAECRPEWQALATHHRHGGLVADYQQGQRGQYRQHQAEGGKVDLVHQHHTQRRADGNRAVRGNAVPGNHPGRMLGAHRADAPAQGGDTDQALGNSQKQTPAEQGQQAQQRHIDCQRRGEGQHAADGNTEQTVDDCLPRAFTVSHTPGERTAEQRRQILQANGQAGNDGAKAQLVMHVTRQHRNRQADAEEGNKGVEDDRKDLQGDREGTGRRGC
ncbi:hypothetical protein D9M71_533180 [compost metagenome]